MIPDSQVFHTAELLPYQADGIVSRTLVKNKNGSIILFAFDAGQELSEHTTRCEAIVQVLEGRAEIAIADQSHTLDAGLMIVIPANAAHSVTALEPFKMLLMMIVP